MNSSATHEGSPHARLASVVFCLGLTLFASTATAQTTTSAAVRGTVVDQSGAALPGARITVTQIETAVVRTTISDAMGGFGISSLAPGRYRVEASLDGFTPTAVDNLVLSVNEQPTIRLELHVGAVEQAITVEAPRSLLQTQSVHVSALIGQAQVRDLPLNGKDFADLVRLAPGAGGDSPGNPPTPGSNPSLSGARAAGNTFTIDGVAANDERFSPSGLALGGGAANLDASGPNLISTEAVQEFRVITSNADATFGRGSGGQINIVVKSGTNQPHGSAYEYFRDDALDARNFFATGDTPPFRQHLYGGTLGGPLVRGRHFFFGSYEGFRQDRQSPVQLFVPNADLIRLVPGDLGRLYRAFYLDRGVVPATPTANGRFFPLPNPSAIGAAGFPSALVDGDLANGEAGSIELLTTATNDIDQDSMVVRTDHTLSTHAHLALRYAHARPTRLQSSSVPTDLVETLGRWHLGVGQLQWQLSDRQLVEVRGGLQRSFMNTLPDGGVPQALTDLGVSRDLGIVVMPGTGDGQLFVSTSNGIDRQTVPQAGLMHTASVGQWTWRSGLDVRWLAIDQANTFGAQPTYVFTGYLGANGILGARAGQEQAVPATTSATVFGATGGPTTPLRRFRSVEQEYFTQADWRIRDDLTLNLGLRYSYFGVYREADDAVSNLYAVDGNGSVVPDAHPFSFGRTANRIEVADDVPFYRPDRNNVQPRLGVAWDVGGRGRTVARAAYGLYHDRLYQFIFSGTLTNPPLAVSSNAANVPFHIGQPFPFSPVATPPQIQAVDPTIENPWTHRVNVAVEQRLSGASSVTVAYVGSRARGLIRTLDPNGSGFIPQNLRPDPRFTDERLYANFSHADYDALQVHARGRVSRVDFTAAYTFGRLLDDSALDRVIFPRQPSLINLGADATQSGIQGGGPLFVDRPREADRGVSDLDVRHTLAVSHLVELPLGVTLGGIVRVRSGTPFTITLGSDVNDDGDASLDRPALLGSLDELYAHDGSKTRYLVPRDEALARLGVPQPVTDPAAAMPRNALRSPVVATYDVSIIKRVDVGRTRLGVELNVFNVFNRVNLGVPAANLSSFGTPNLRFGEIQTTATAARQLQLGVKWMF